MSTRALVTWLIVGSLLTSTPAFAQQHVVDPATMAQAIDRQGSVDAANRQVVERVRSRPDVQAAAERLGLDVKQARSAIAQLDSAELAAVAGQAQAVDNDPAGGQRYIVVSVTTLLLIIIIILLIAD
jgi:hypothetical protein